MLNAVNAILRNLAYKKKGVSEFHEDPLHLHNLVLIPHSMTGSEEREEREESEKRVRGGE
jgi:hypothetical protein